MPDCTIYLSKMCVILLGEVADRKHYSIWLDLYDYLKLCNVTNSTRVCLGVSVNVPTHIHPKRHKPNVQNAISCPFP